MRLVRAHVKFYENKDVLETQEAAEALRIRLERQVAAWLMDTGLWAVDIHVSVKPGVVPGHLGVSAQVEARAEPMRHQAGGL